MADLTTRIGTLNLSNPVLLASGTCGYGEELARFTDLCRLGGVIAKTVTRLPRAGNPPPRVCETPAGMLNAIGLQNVGLEAFIRDKLPRLRELQLPLVVNVAGETVDDFGLLCAELGQQEGVQAIELNISCPNVAHGLDFATDPRLAEAVVASCRRATSLPLWAKLSPNVSDVAVIARAAEAGGAAALSLVNTFLGMAVDIESRRPRLANGTGGLSGPAIKPLALRAVWSVLQAVRVPVIGIGGIASAEDALEFLITGASAVQVGTATFVQPQAGMRIVTGLGRWLDQHGISRLQDVIGTLARP